LQQLVVALQVDRMRREAGRAVAAAKLVLAQLQPLDHRAPRSIQDHDAAGEQVAQSGFGVGQISLAAGEDGSDCIGACLPAFRAALLRAVRFGGDRASAGRR